MRKYSPALPVNSGRTTRVACAPAAGRVAAWSMHSPLACWRLPIRRGRAHYPPNETPRGWLPGALSFRLPCFGVSGAPAPQPAIAPQHELQVVLVARPLLVLGQLGLLLDAVPALAFARRDLHGLGRVLEEHQLVLRVLLSAEAVARPGMAGDQPVPVHRQHLLDRRFGLERVEVDHAAARDRAD